MFSTKSFSKKTMGLFSLVMINVIAVDSLRSLPISAEYGFSLIFFYIVAAIIFFIPSILISAELATAYPNTGGIYVWVREAFGARMGFLVIWFQWVYNVVWYPTIMTFIVASTAYFFNPQIANDKWYLVLTSVGLFWLITLVNCFGMRVSSFVSTIGALFGTLLPMILIVFLGVVWLMSGKPIQADLSWHAFFPHITEMKNLAFLSAVVFGLIGMEMSAVHAGEVRQPERAYPRALFISGAIILLSLIFASLAIAIVVPHSKLNLVTGLLQAFVLIFNAYHLKWMAPIIIACVIIGSVSGVVAWIIGPSKGLLIAARDGCLPKYFGYVNKHGAPVPVLILQGIIFTLLCAVFFLLPTVSGSYWLLSAMTAQLGLLVYILLFASAYRLRCNQPHVARSFKVPGGKVGLFLISLVGILGCLVAIVVGFFPPTAVRVGGALRYELTLIISLAIFSFIPFVLYRQFSKNGNF